MGPRLGLGAAIVAWAIAASPSALSGAMRADGRLPGAVDAPPAWLGADLPFDVDGFFRSPPPGRNAAPLVLDALLDFDEGMAACYPGDASARSRARAAGARLDRAKALQDRGGRPPTPAEIDAMIVGFDAGFRALAQAQGRPACRFAVGLAPGDPLPHLDAARNVGRIAALRALRSLDRGDFARPLQDLRVVLRLARDLEPGGTAPTQLAAAEITTGALQEIAAPMLADPRLRPAHCEQLIRLLLQHEARGVDGFAEGVKGEYLANRVLLRDAAARPDDGDRPAAEAAREAAVAAVLGQVVGRSITPRRVAASVEALKRLDRPGYDAQVKLAGEDAKSWLIVAKAPYAERAARIATAGLEVAPARLEADFFANVLTARRPRLHDATLALGRAQALVRAYVCVGALRRSQIVNRQFPTDLARPLEAVGIPSVPLDPFDGRPLRLATVGRSTVVYSVGADGRDDGGLVDARGEPKPGDLLVLVPDVTPAEGAQGGSSPRAGRRRANPGP